jgi:hypothetical protein
MNDVSVNPEGAEAVLESPATPSAPVPQFEDFKVFQLSKPVERPNGSSITELTLRSPNGLDVFEIGGQVSRNVWAAGGTSMYMEQDTARLQRYLLKLSGEPLMVVGKIPARDIKLMYDWLTDELSAVGN